MIESYVAKFVSDCPTGPRNGLLRGAVGAVSEMEPPLIGVKFGLCIWHQVIRYASIIDDVPMVLHLLEDKGHVRPELVIDTKLKPQIASRALKVFIFEVSHCVLPLLTISYSYFPN